MTSAELAERAGLSVETVAHYESVGLIRPAINGHACRYGEDAQLRLELVKKGKRLGFALSEIKHLIDSRSAAPATPSAAAEGRGPGAGDAPASDRRDS